MLNKIVYTLFASFLLTGGVMAQTELSLGDAISYALSNSSVIANAQLDIEKGAQVINETRASALPQISAGSSITGNPIVQQFVLPAEAFGGPAGEFSSIRVGQNWNAMTQVQLSQQLYNQQLFTGIKAAKGSLEYYELLKEMSEENVIQQVAANYYMVIINREKMSVIASNIERIEQLEKIVAEQYKVGLVRKIDLDRISVNKSNSEAMYVDLKRAVAQQENLLKYYIGMPVTETINIPEFPIDELAESLNLTAIADEYEVQSLVDYQMMAKQKELLEFDRKAQKAAYFPTLSLDANYVYNTQSEKFNLYSRQALNYDVSAISLRLNIPIFDGLAKRSRVKQSEIALKKMDEDMKNTSNSLRMAYENAKSQFESAITNINNQKKNKQLAEDVLENTQNDYSNGLATLTDLLNSESELLTAQNSYNEALINFKIAEIDLAKSQGKLRTLINY